MATDCEFPNSENFSALPVPSPSNRAVDEVSRPDGCPRTGLPRSWKSHGISGIFKFSGISGKVMEFLLKLGKVMEKSWYFEIGAMEFYDTVMEKSWKSHGILPQIFRGNPAGERL